MAATELGMPGVDGELETPSEAARAARIAHLRRSAATLAAIVRDAGPGIFLVDRHDAALLRATAVRAAANY